MSIDTQGLKWAQKFHEIYERLAPEFGYETRTDTRQFDPESKNGRLMVAVCAALIPQVEATGILAGRQQAKAVCDGKVIISPSRLSSYDEGRSDMAEECGAAILALPAP